MNKLTGLLFIAFILLTACSNNTAGTQLESKSKEDAVSKELIIANREIAASLDPVQPLTSSYLRSVGAAEALFRINAEGEVEPSLAEGALEKDATTWEIKLRPNVHFWSGTEVNADAVIASLERSKALDPQSLPFLEELDFLKVDNLTVQVKTKREHMNVPLNLSYYQTVIHNAEAKHDAVETMDLTGMYKVVEFIPKRKMVLEINRDYWGQKPTIERIVNEEISDEQTRVLSVLSGRSHISLYIPVTSLDQLQARSDIQLHATPAANTQTIYLNVKQTQLKDVKVRQALSWGLDREELVLLGAEGQSFPVTTWLASNPAYAEGKNAVYPKQDVEQANRLLDEAGWVKASDGIRYKDKKPLTLRLMTWGGDKALGEALQHQWTKLGVKAEVQHGDYSLIEAARKSGDWDASIEAWSTFGDPYALLQGQYSPEGSANYGGYQGEEINALLAQLRSAADEALRKELALKINERAAEQAPMIYLFPRPQLTAVHSSLEEFEGHFRQFENIVHSKLSFNDLKEK